MLYKRIKYYLLKKKLKNISKLPKRIIGQKGEEFAALTLEFKGYRILGRNIRIGGGEIDILAVKGADLCVFEVKLRSSDVFGDASEAINNKKKRKLKKLTDKFISKKYKTLQLKLFTIDIREGRLYYDIIDIEQ